MLAKIKSNGAFCLIKKLFSAFALHTRIWPFSPFTFTFCLAVSTEIMSMSDAIAFVLRTLHADIARIPVPQPISTTFLGTILPLLRKI